jgi:hypothetical protein
MGSWIFHSNQIGMHFTETKTRHFGSSRPWPTLRYQDTNEDEIRSDRDEMNPPNTYFKARENTRSCHFPPQSCHHAGVKSLKYARSLPTVSSSSSEPTPTVMRYTTTNHSAPRHLLGVSLGGPNPSYATSLNPGLGRSICKGDTALLSGLHHVLTLANQLSSVPLHGEEVCLICILTSLSLRFPPLQCPVTPRYKAITVNYMSVRGLLFTPLTVEDRIRPPLVMVYVNDPLCYVHL